MDEKQTNSYIHITIIKKRDPKKSHNSNHISINKPFRDPPQFFLFLQAFEYMLSGGEKHVKKRKRQQSWQMTMKIIDKNNLY